jgi:peptidyl-prolyl isomerase G (cyclophilin G)
MYKNTRVHTVKRGQWMIGGDITDNTSQGGTSIFENNRSHEGGRRIADENFRLNHNGQGIVGMCNGGPHSAMSQWYITQKEMPHLDGNHVVVGRVLEGSDTLKIIDKSSGLCLVEPTKVITVIACGEIVDY